MDFKHISVLLDETIDGLDIKPDGIYVDGTLGGGGHSYEILRRLSPKGRLIGIDQDGEALKAAGERLKKFENQITLVRSNYCEIDKVLKDYGEDKFAKNIAKHIVLARKEKPLETTKELSEVIKRAIPMKVQAKGGHPAKKTFQAIRIEVNQELTVLKESIDKMIDLLKPNGRICIITFHSLEDRIVKTKFRENENPCTCPPNFPVCVCGKKSKGKVITRKPIIPSEDEIEENKRAKSSKLRIFERC